MIKELQIDRRLIRRSGGSHRYVLATVEAPEVERAEARTPVNVALVIDRSGSMNGGKIAQVREAAEYAVNQLGEKDRFAVVAYDDEIRLVMPSSLASADAKADAVRRIRELEARAQTDLCGGWLHGCQQVAEYLRNDAVARCMLLTDGLANVGIVDPVTIVNHAQQLRARGIVTSTFGVGADFDEVLLQRMADAGGGNFCFIESANDIPRFIGQELEETLDIAVRDAYLDVLLPGGVMAESLNGFNTEHRPGRTRISLGSLVSGQVIDAVVRLRFPRGASGEEVRVAIETGSASGDGEVFEDEVAFEFARTHECDAQPRNQAVDRRVAALYAGRVTREASELNREGRYDDARQRIERCAERIRSYADDDAELLATVGTLEESAERFGRDMDAMMRKHMHYRSHSMMKGRMTSGASKRRVRHGSVTVVVDRRREEPAIRALQAVAQPARFLMGELELRVSLPVDISCQDVSGRVLSSVEELDLIGEQLGAYGARGARILFVNARLHDNWFSHYHASLHTAISAIADWDDLAGVDLAAYLAYEILVNGLHIASPNFDLLAIAHDETRGCLFDFCGDKRDIEVKLQNMDICAECRRTLDGWRIPSSPVEDFCVRIRALAQASASAHKAAS